MQSIQNCIFKLISEHEEVMKREKEYKGIWINSNMKSHESFKDSKCQVDRAVVEITSSDGSNKRKLGMLGVLSDVEGLYKPDAFGGKFYSLSIRDGFPKFATGLWGE